MPDGIEIIAPSNPSTPLVLTEPALEFLANLERTFRKRRAELLNKRRERQVLIDKGEFPKILPDSEAIRHDPTWKIAPIPKDLMRRWVEITGPTDKKMVINALNSGADIFMADFEDANSPTWSNMIEGQANLKEAVTKKLSFKNAEGKQYSIKDNSAVLMCRPRGWHLTEKHLLVDGKPMSASLFDFGLYFFHNAKELLKRGSGPYFYLPKLESHLEARLWNNVFVEAQDLLNIPQGSIRATVLIETIMAAFEMEEILYELRDHSAGLNAGRWDYIFSVIKKLHKFNIIFPDRDQITMATSFMTAYANLLVRTCHKRKIHAIGGMSAFIPSRKDPQINKIAFAKVFDDKQREVSQGFDGTWVAHPDLVQLAREPFQKATLLRLNQINFELPPIKITPTQILDFKIPGGQITENGVRSNINVTLRYLAAWLSGSGAVGINNLMEDAATAEISRSQLWQWVHSPDVQVEGMGKLDLELFFKLVKEEGNKIQKDSSFPEEFQKNLAKSKSLLERLVQESVIPEFLTTIAYEQLG